MAGCSQDEKTETGSKIKPHVESHVEKSSAKASPLNCTKTQTKVTCKLTLTRTKEDREVTFTWKSPRSKDNRKRTIVLPASHATIFDARLTKGREKGTWKVNTEVNAKNYSTNFTL